MADTSQAQSVLSVDEVADLRERISNLENELKKEREKNRHHRQKAKDKDDDHDDDKDGKDKDKRDLTKSLDKVNEQMTRLTRGLFFAGLEAMALSAKVTREFVDRTDERSEPHRRDTWAKMMTDLPVDAAKGLSDALENSVDDIEKVVDKFYAKYKE